MPRSLLMLERRVMFLSQLRGSFWCALCSMCALSLRGASEVFDEHSSTNTKRSGSIEEITITRKAALRNSSRSLAPSVLFSAEAHLPESPGEGRFAHLNPCHPLQVLLPV